ncbi:MAG TPA: YicC/YloC family endoribonuclease [Sumerlaeia bacterium]|nr:YicC/YloC family endoribonuclease [Sumerlaeia bacterium]
MSPVRSMTGFGAAEGSSELGSMRMEVKSVNHRFLEPRIRLPRELGDLELPMMRIIREKLQRGKVDVNVHWTPAPAYIPRLAFNQTVLRRYRDEIAALAEPLDMNGEVSLEYLLALPGVADTDTPEVHEPQLLALASDTLEQALNALIAERRREGASLEEELASRLDQLDQARKDIDQRRVEVVDAMRARLAKKAEEWAQSLSIQIDPDRLEGEVLLFAERADITEELVRLRAHIEAFRRLLASSPERESQGKPMEFLSQELLREANTIASKCRDTTVSSLTLGIRNEIEKIREQVQNVE